MRHPESPARSSRRTRTGLTTAPDDDAWTGLTTDPLPTDLAGWAVRPSCGALVTFCGTVRDHADGRVGVTGLRYEAYESLAETRLREIIGEARHRWPDIGRVALLHRLGELTLTDVAVVVTVAAPHRDVAFDAARWCIDAVKASVPIWKFERWERGADWGTHAQPMRPVAEDAGAEQGSSGELASSTSPGSGRS